MFEEGEIFNLKNEETGEVITFSVDSKTFEYVEDSQPSGHIFASGDTFMEKGTIFFTNNDDCSGEILVKADFGEEFEFFLFLYGCFGEQYYDEPFPVEDFYVWQTDYYDEGYIMGSNSTLLVFSKEEGILAIYDVEEETKIYGLVE